MGSLSLLYYFLNFLCMGGYSCYWILIGAGLATILFVIYMNSSFNFFWNLIPSFSPNILPDPARVNNTRLPGTTVHSAAEENILLPDRSHIHDTPQPLRRRLQFSPSDDHLSDNTNQTSFRSHVPPLPRYWIKNPLAYFRMIEMIFDEHGVTSERARFSALVSALSHDERTLDAVTDVLQQSDASRPYSLLRETLLSHSVRPEAECLDDFSNVQRGNDTVLTYYLRLRSLLKPRYAQPSTLSDDLIRRRLLDSVDAQTRLALYPYETTCLEDLAKHADRLLARVGAVQQNISPPPCFPRQRDYNRLTPSPVLPPSHFSPPSSATSHFSSSRGSFPSPTSPLARDVPQRHINPPFSSRSPFRRQTPFPPSPCSYHRRFGDRAFRCEGPPCPMFSSETNTTPKNAVQSSMLSGGRGGQSSPMNP